MENTNLYCGDCLDIMANIPSGSIDLIVTDPPYLVSSTNGGGTINNIKKLNKSLSDLKKNIDITQGYNIELYGEQFIRVMKQINIYLWCNKAQIPEYFDFYVKKHKCKFDIICWHKTNALPTYSNKYLSDTEYLLYFRKGKGKCFPKSYDDAKTFYVAPINHKDKKMFKHPTQKPVDMLEYLIRTYTNEGETVLDFTAGSGSTGVAAINTNRRFIGIELDEQYFKIAENRINEAIKNKESEETNGNEL